MMLLVYGCIIAVISVIVMKNYYNSSRFATIFPRFVSFLAHNPSVSLSNQNGLGNSMKSHILALDFDGVICDSAGESSHSAVIAAYDKWPSIFNRGRGARPFEMSEEFSLLRNTLKSLRPIIETGYENLLLTRYIRSKFETFQPISSVEGEGKIIYEKDLQVIIDEIYQQWSPSFRDNLLKSYGEARPDLISLYGNVRDKLMTADFQSWLSKNSVYPHINSLLSHTTSYSIPRDTTDNNIVAASIGRYSNLATTVKENIDRLYIISTKQERFLSAILKANDLGHLERSGQSNHAKELDDSQHETNRNSLGERSNIYDLENRYGAKIDVLAELALFHLNQPFIESTSDQSRPLIHFVEDRYQTLRKIQLTLASELGQEKKGYKLLRSQLRLYLVDWGYNTAAERKAATEDPQITLLTPETFASLVNQIFPSN